MSGKTISTSETKIEALKLQSSAYGVTIPVVAGVTRIPGNLIYYNDFQAVPKTTSQSGKGGVKTTGTTYSYYASVLMGLCAGQINAIPRIWVGKQLYADDSGAVTTSASTESISVAPSTTATVVHAAAFSAHVSLTMTTSSGSGIEAGDSWSYQLAEGVDFTVTNGVYTFSSGAPTGTGTVVYQYTGTGAGSSALQKLGLTMFPGTLAQSPASWVTTRHPSDALSYATMAYVSADTYALGSGAQVENHNFEVVGPGAFTLGSSVADVDPTIFSINLLLDGRYGARLPSTFFQSTSDWSNYCVANSILMSPALTTQMKAADFLALMAQLTNTGIVWSDGRLQMRPYGDVSASAFGQTYTPNVTPIYDLTDDVYVVAAGAPPVNVTRKKQSDAYNHVRVQFQNRANQYAKEIAEAKDQADIEANGLRSAAIIQADWICDPGVARIVAQLLLQRYLYVRATYEWKLPWNFAFLEPMDLVTITDSSLGLNKTAVRITAIEEDGEDFKFTAESFALGVANAALYGTQVGAGFAQDYNALPGSASICYIFEAPVPLTTDRLEIMVAATGSGQYWGGCRVWGSLDGVNYKEIGKISGGSRGGTITANMTAGAANMSVNLISGSLTSGSSSDASNLTTLSYVGGANPEYLAFQTANLTSSQHYTLSGLVRGAYGSTAAAHTTGDPFVRIDENIARSGPLSKSLIGTTVHVKLTSFNIFGFAEESLAAVTDYTYTVAGTFAKAPPTGLSSFAATGVINGIKLTATLPANTPQFTVSTIYLWENTTNVFPGTGAAPLTSGLTDAYTRTGLTAGTTRFYWAAPVDTSLGYANIGPVSGPVSATSLAAFAADIGTGAVTAIKTSIAQLSDIANSLGTVITGTYSGTANIDITGTANFGGAQSSGGNTWAVVANASGGSFGGVRGLATTGFGVQGTAAGINGVGVYGSASGSGGSGVVAAGTGGALAMTISGTVSQGNTTYTWNGFTIAAPGGSTTTVLHNDGVYRDPVTNARVLAAIGFTPLSTTGTAAAAAQLSNSGHTYQLTGGSVTGTGVATFSGSNKPGNSTTGIWVEILIDGTAYDMQLWPRV